MVSTTIQDAVNEQIRHEVYSAYLYLSMSAYCESLSLHGSAKWLRVQWEEELSHALRLFDYLFARGGRAVLQAIDRPPADFKSPLELFQQVLSHEQKVTSLIDKLYDVALKENDHAAQVELQWFIKEQVEEEKNASAIVQQLEMIGGHTGALMMLDRQLGKRGAEK